MKVLGLVGMPGSGKDEVCNILSARFDVVRMGDAVIEETQHRGLEISDANVGKVAVDLRVKEGMDAIARRILPKIKDSKKEAVLINGIRGFDEINYFKNNLGDFEILAVLSSPKTRFKRLSARKREDDVQDIEAFRERDRRELAWGLEKAIAKADYTIDNEGTLEELKEHVTDFMNAIGLD
jgi:dephospho-CoA kinase